MAALDKALREDEERYRRFSRFFGDGVRGSRPRGATVPDAEIMPDEPEPEPSPASEPVTPAPAPANATMAEQTGEAGAAQPPAERGDTLPGSAEAPPDPAAPLPEAPGPAAPETGPEDRDTPPGNDPDRQGAP
jgi:hypothetical protein